MLRGKQYALAGAMIALLAGLAAHRLARAPEGPRRGEPEDATVVAVRAIQARMAGKRQVADEVIAGRLSLLEAAAVFRRLDTVGPPIPPIRDRFPDLTSDDEAYCRSVVEYVQSTVPADENQEEWTRRLRDELETRLRDGTLHLPEP